MKKMRWMALSVFALVIYLNVGYLIAYSTDPVASPTTLSKAVYKTINFMDVFSHGQKGFNGFDYFLVTISWPGFVIMGWIVNFALLLWKVFVWLFAGGVLRWLGLI